MNLQEFTLEVSLKPFLRRNAPPPETVAETLFTQWRAASRSAESLAVLLWVGDGSEILDFNFDLEATFDWSRYIGIMNRERTPEDEKHDPANRGAFVGRPFEEGTSEVNYLFLKELVSIFKETGGRVCGKPVRVGIIFDPGPEFTISDFKYRRHRELLQGGYPGHRRDVVSCYAKLHADDRPYAGFPGGIPEGLPFGTFFGRQLRHFAAVFDFDFVWFSNGFGFGNFPWNFAGVLFDGERFHPEHASQVGEEMMDFWRRFRAECTLPVLVRGTNLSTGRDLACDGVPLRKIYDGGYLTQPPVNSPWSALNRDYGSEMTGFLSHIAGFPTMDFTFRFYIHDPWFLTRPWLDGYESEAWDLHLALSASRCDSTGKVHTPNRIHMLTVDDCRGELPDQVAEEVTPELNRAIRNAPDAPGPLVWLYPFDEYSDLLEEKPERLPELLAGDLFLRDAVNLGLPLNTVLSTRDIAGLPEGRVIVTPVPENGSPVEEILWNYQATDGALLLYGSLSHTSERFRKLFDIDLQAPLEGEFIIDGENLPATFAPGKRVVHRGIYSGGGLRETGGHTPLFTLRQGKEERTLAAAAGNTLWVRTSTGRCNAFSVRDEYVNKIPREAWFAPAELLVSQLSRFGWSLHCERRSTEDFHPFNAVSMRDNSFLFSGHNRTTTTGHLWRTPFGAPVPTGCDVDLLGGFSHFRFGASWRLECRLFLQSADDGVVTCHRNNLSVHGFSNQWEVRGLKRARLNLFLPPGAEKTLELQLPEKDHYDNASHAPLVGFEVVEVPGYQYIRCTEELNGPLRVCW